MKTRSVLSTIAIILGLLTIVEAGIANERARRLTVTRNDDRNEVCLAGDCSLREAVNSANASPANDIIGFAGNLRTITLNDEEIVIGGVQSGALTLEGPGAHHLTIDGGTGSNRIFYINSAEVRIAYMTLTGGGGTGANSTGSGGAIYSYRGLLSLDGVHVTGNNASHFGGGIASENFMSPFTYNLKIANSTVAKNFAGHSGGGFYIAGRKLILVNSTISTNESVVQGGGFYLQGAVEMRNATITNNKARFGGGIYVDDISDLLVGNTLLAGNIASQIAPEIYSVCDSSCTVFTSVGGNFVGDSHGDSTNTGSPFITFLPSDIRDTAPLLGPLQNNGGATLTHELLSQSAAIDAGLNAVSIDPSNRNKLAYDQRGSGYLRILSANGIGRRTVDIGAFEFGDHSPSLTDALADTRELETDSVSVTNVEELYSAINDPNGKGTRIVLAPGIYVLSAIDPNGLERPNRGRLELQEHMSLSGVRGDRAAVLIDASLLPPSTFESSTTGVIRVGFGSNAIEWLTINGVGSATASIETDLHWADGPSRVSVAHVVTINGNRGIDVRNIFALGREINVYINDSNISGGLEGIRIVNQNNSPGARIFVRMTGNYVHDNEIGCLIANARVSEGTIRVQSIGDTFTGNGTGVLLNGGLIQGANIANSNYVSFEADGSRIINNNGPVFAPPGGLYATAGQSGLLNATSNNTLDIHLRNCQIFGNNGTDFAAFGARSGANVLPGTNNRTKIYFYGPGRNNKVDATDSVPVEPGGTNTVTIINATTPFPGDLMW